MDANQVQFHPQVHNPTFGFNHNNKFRRDCPPRSFPTSSTMNPSELTFTSEPSGMDMWSSPLAPPVSRPRPATIHEASFSYCLPEEFNGLPAWDSSTLPLQQTQNGYQQQGFNNQHDFYPSSIAGDSEHNWTPAPTENNVLGTEFGGWQQKSNDDMVEMDTDMTIGQAITTDEAIPVLDLRPSAFQLDHHYDQTFKSRPLSGSSFTMSTTGPLSEMTSFEDFSATMSDAHSFVSDYPPRSNRNSLMSSTQLSPVASPRMTPQTRSELVRTQSRGRASPSPRPTMRSAPYNMDSSRSKRWSTGSYATTPSRRQSPFVFNYGPQEMFSPLGSQRLPSHHSSPVPAQAQLPLNMSNLQSQQYPYLSSNNNAFQRNTMVLPSSTGYNDNSRFDAPAPLLSHGLFRMLQSNADPHSLHSHYADLSDPPDLYGALSEDQLQPPPEDMNPEDPDMIPHEQELRFPGDLYTPRWVRGHGNKREGWCGICKPGRWLVLKNSAFWYDKSFTHGISAATGAPFQEPGETRRMDGNPDVWEGSCGSCGDWVALVSSKKKGTTWFRHAYKCHTHPKIKDAPKRRRESSHQRNNQQKAPPRPTSSGIPPVPLLTSQHVMGASSEKTPGSSGSNDSVRTTVIVTDPNGVNDDLGGMI